MDTQVIKSFLVGLGFGVDESSLAKFNKSIASATLRVTALYGSVQATATGIAFGIAKISKSFEDMGYEYRLIAPAFNKFLLIRNEIFKAYGAAGVNISKAVQQSVLLNFSLTKTKIALEAIYRSVAVKFFPLLLKQSETFRDKLYQNMPKIQNVLERFVFFVFKAFDATVILGERVWSILTRIYDFFVMLHKATDGWSTIVLGVIAAWKLLNLSFLATPLGAILGLGLAILTLWDDFKTFVEGGQSVINWGSETTKMIVGVTAAVVGLTAAIVAIASVYTLWTNSTKVMAAAQAVLNVALTANPIGLLIAGLTALIGLLTLADSKWKIFGGHVAEFFSGLGGKILDFVAGSHVENGVQNKEGFFTQAAKGVSNTFAQPNAQANLSAQGGAAPGAAGVSPISNNTVNRNQSQQNISQSTNINVTSSADAQSVGKSVGAEQSRVNSDMARNFASPAR